MIQVNCSVQLRKHACSIHPLPDPVVSVYHRGATMTTLPAPHSSPPSLLHMYGVCELPPLLVSRPSVSPWRRGHGVCTAVSHPLPLTP